MAERTIDDMGKAFLELWTPDGVLPQYSQAEIRFSAECLYLSPEGPEFVRVVATLIGEALAEQRYEAAAEWSEVQDWIVEFAQDVRQGMTSH